MALISVASNRGLLLHWAACQKACPSRVSSSQTDARIISVRQKGFSLSLRGRRILGDCEWSRGPGCPREAPRMRHGGGRRESPVCSAGAGAGGYSEGLEHAAAAISKEEAAAASSSGNREPAEKPSTTVRVLQAATAAIIGGTLLAVAITLARGGPTALQEAVTKSGFTAAFSLIFFSEIGDKTFFIAALLAMTHSRFLVLAGASAALALMSVISVVLGRLFRSVPAQLQTTVPVGEYLAIALLLWFGVRNIRAALATPSSSDGSLLDAEEGGELAEAEEFVSKVEAEKLDTPWAVFREAFSLVFVAEWGDRSMLATIALGAAQSPVGVALGASLAHVVATAIAILGGALLAKYISEKVIGLISGVLFIGFAAATYWGVF